MASGVIVVDVPAQQLRDWLRQGDAVLIDVREPAERSETHSDDSEPMPLGVLAPAALRETHAGKRIGVVVELLQRAAADPPSISLALPKGQPISPIVRDSHAFGICVVPEGDPFLPRHFARRDVGVEDITDPFDGIGIYTLETGSPLIERAAACFDCSVTMHIDFEGDHELYVASVIASREHGGG